MTVRRLRSCLFAVLLGHAAWAGRAFSAAQEPAKQEPDQKKKDTYFAGLVTEWSATQIVVSRAVLGKNPEKRTFKITPATKVEGKLKTRIRVTVSYTTGDDGDTATLIVVHAQQTTKK